MPGTLCGLMRTTLCFIHYILSHSQHVAVQHVLAVQDFFTYLDIIVFVEATIYQMDEDNEKLCGQGGQEDRHVLKGKLACHISTSELRLELEGNSSHRTPLNQVNRQSWGFSDKKACSTSA